MRHQPFLGRPTWQASTQKFSKLCELGGLRGGLADMGQEGPGSQERFSGEPCEERTGTTVGVGEMVQQVMCFLSKPEGTSELLAPT